MTQCEQQHRFTQATQLLSMAMTLTAAKFKWQTFCILFVFSATLNQLTAVEIYTMPVAQETVQKLKFIGNQAVTLDVIEEDGTPLLYLKSNKLAVVTMSLPEMAQCGGKKIKISYEVRTKGVPKPKQDYDGFRILLRYQSKGNVLYPQGQALYGDCDWKTISHSFIMRQEPENCEFRIIFHAGEVWIRKFTIEMEDPSAGIKQHGFNIANILEQWQPIRGIKRRSEHDMLSIETRAHGGFTSPPLEWNAHEIKQIEVEFMASGTPGSLELRFSGVFDGEPFTSFLRSSLLADGNFHTIVFPVANNPLWRGNITSLNLIWHVRGHSTLGLRSVYAQKEINLLPAAKNISAGCWVNVSHLRPRGEYELSFVGSNVPQIKLECLDRNYKVIKTVILPAESKSVTFRTPELTMTGRLYQSTEGNGYPSLHLKNLPASTPYLSRWRGKWIWCQKEVGPEHTKVWFERTFDLPEVPEDAQWTMTGDDQVHAYVNGHKLTLGHSTWPQPQKIQIAKYLKPGRNVLRAMIYNAKLNGGFLCDLYISCGNEQLFLDSDNNWKFKISDKEPQIIDQNAVVIGDAEVQPWTSRIGHIYCGPQGKLEFIEGTPGTLVAKVLTLPYIDIDRFNMKLLTPDGIKTLEVSFSPASGLWKEGEKITISYRIPNSINGGELYLADEYVKLSRNVHIASIKSHQPEKKELAECKVVYVGSRPKILINNIMHSPVLWGPGDSLVDNQRRASKVRDGHYTGINNYLVYAGFKDFWKSPDEFDFSRFDAAVEGIFQANPDSRLLLQLYCYMPDWWLKANPVDTTKYYGNVKPFLWHDRQALASKKWLADAKIGIKAIIDHIKQSPHSDRFFGVSISESVNSEWFWRRGDPGNYGETGYSKGDYATFRSYLREKYNSDEKLAEAWNSSGTTLDNFTMPAPDDISFGRYGVLLDPKLDRKLMDWFEFRSRSIAEAIMELCKCVKQETDNKWLAGAYYGYFVEFCNLSRRSIHDIGHNGFLEVARSPYVDFVRAPSRYDARYIGQANGNMIPQDTFKLRNKLVYIEHDFRSFTETREVANHWGRHNTPAESIGALNRDFGMMLAQGVTQYWLDFGSWLEEKLLLDVIREQSHILDELPPSQGLTPYEFCIVGDRTSIYYTKRNSFDSMIDATFGSLGRSFNEAGMPFRIIVTDDLLEPGLVPPHKFYLMTNALTMSKERRTALLKRFKEEKATVLWLYAPGLYYPDSQGIMPTNVGDFLGLKCKMTSSKKTVASMVICPEIGGGMCSSWNSSAPWFYVESGYDKVLGRDAAGQAMLVEKKINGVTHYFSTLPNLPDTLMQNLAEKSGVHVYGNSGDPLWIGNDVIFLHAKSGGEKAIILRPGTRMKAIVGPFSGELESEEKFNAIAGQTYGFLITKKQTINKRYRVTN